MVDDTILRYPAIQVRQRIGSFWAVSVPAQVLLKYTMPDRLRMIADPHYEGTDEWRQHVRFLGNQRELQLQRLKAVASYVDGVDSTFPNSLIIAAPSQRVDDLEGEPWRLERSDDGCDHIVIPPRLRRLQLSMVNTACILFFIHRSSSANSLSSYVRFSSTCHLQFKRSSLQPLTLPRKRFGEEWR